MLPPEEASVDEADTVPVVSRVSGTPSVEDFRCFCSAARCFCGLPDGRRFCFCFIEGFGGAASTAAAGGGLTPPTWPSPSSGMLPIDAVRPRGSKPPIAF